MKTLAVMNIETILQTPHSVALVVGKKIPAVDKFSTAKKLLRVLLPALYITLAGCSGESRPFVEAVEVSELDLATLAVGAPEDAIEPLFILSNEEVKLTLGGIDSAGSSVTIPAENRSWKVSDSSVASINDKGVLTGRADGVVDVSVKIAHIVSNSYQVTVSNATLASIESIEGEEAVDPCRAQRYLASGIFSDGSIRTLTSVNWSLDDTTAQVLAAEDGSASVTATTPGDVQLVASADTYTLERELTVNDSLDSLVISPLDLGMTSNSTRKMIATGSYIGTQPVDPADSANDEEPTTGQTSGNSTVNQDITADVVWSAVAAGEATATISNDVINRGELHVTGEGSVFVQASCGPDTGEGTIVISASDSTASGASTDLSFDVVDDNDELYNLPLAARNINLRLSTGTNFSASDEVTREASWEVREGINVLSVNNIGATKGQVTLLQVGTAVIRASLEGRFADLTINVQ
ncbi:MAG: hypothetical protein V3U76_06335 [Granulosicoccus sp.]